MINIQNNIESVIFYISSIMTVKLTNLSTARYCPIKFPIAIVISSLSKLLGPSRKVRHCHGPVNRLPERFLVMRVSVGNITHVVLTTILLRANSRPATVIIHFPTFCLFCIYFLASTHKFFTLICLK